MFLKRKQQPLNELPREDRWSLLQGTHEARPILVRRNDQAKDFRGHAEMPVRLGIAVPFNDPDDRGFPGKGELINLEAIEDHIVAAVDEAQVGRLVVVITTGGMREYVSYVRSRDLGDRVAGSVRKAVSSHEVQHYVADDPGWDGYAEFA